MKIDEVGNTFATDDEKKVTREPNKSEAITSVASDKENLGENKKNDEPDELQIMTIKDETDAYENWRNLGTSVKKRKSYYGAAAPEILHVTEGKKIKIGILTNGNLLHKCVNLNKKKYRFVDTCPLDSVIQGLTTTYCDSNVVQICMEQMLSPQVVEIVKQLATGTTKLHTYKLRGEIYLSSNFEFRKTTLINNTIRVECAMNAVNVLQYFLGDDFHSTCTTNICDSKECDVTHQTLCSKTIPININIIKKNGFKDLIQSAEDCLMFNKCNFTTELSNILFIDTCDCVLICYDQQ
ncbi:uncharacterized protein LOC116166738 [Photinus pyralis]|uniref:uncharacterized protein LOC116166738 n=1 Tax=Photinus pyralis TaxID=7054 RepID=UPI0012674D9C|nr:uncharacterized protein LOC116166738 [Photinus pyralis]